MGTFIIVDDDFCVRYLINATLKYAGHEILAEVDNTNSALLHLKNGKVPDVILLDMVLPGTPGYGIVDYIRENHQTVKIAMCTGLNEEKVMRMIPAGGYDAYIQKPFKSEEFLAKVGALLPKPAAPPPSPSPQPGVQLPKDCPPPDGQPPQK